MRSENRQTHLQKGVSSGFVPTDPERLPSRETKAEGVGNGLLEPGPTPALEPSAPKPSRRSISGAPVTTVSFGIASGTDTDVGVLRDA